MASIFKRCPGLSVFTVGLTHQKWFGMPRVRAAAALVRSIKRDVLCGCSSVLKLRCQLAHGRY